ncbi:hypothetical protein [Salinibacter altiplanensis]|uniref:hypothetical protein n=1 Tax=Salinibacter altiplanensis TaxID=1803181 RepID=UPI000C9F4B7B|nr:hypothetical protein [Salinibacter altiplanensis]
MPDEPTELAVGESFVTSETGDALRVETTRSEEHLFTTTYRDAETGTLRLALQVDITTGAAAIDPRSYDADFWTLVVEGLPRPDLDLQSALASVDDPGIEVDTERRELHVQAEKD